MTGNWRVRRSHGMLGGTLVALLGIWGGIIPFVGPYFHYAYTPDTTWTYNSGRLYLEILPGAVALLGGVLLIITAARHLALFGAFLGIVAGAWFAVGNVLAPLWTTANPAGVPAATTTLRQVAEQLGFFTGLGVVIVLIAAVAAGRLTAVPGVPAPVTPLTSIGSETESTEDSERPTEPVSATSGSGSEASESTRSFGWRRVVP